MCVCVCVCVWWNAPSGDAAEATLGKSVDTSTEDDTSTWDAAEATLGKSVDTSTEDDSTEDDEQTSLQDEGVASRRDACMVAKMVTPRRGAAADLS